MIKIANFEHHPRFAEIRPVYRSRRKPQEQKRLSAPADTERYLRAFWKRDTIELIEEFVVVYLNTAHLPLGWVKVGVGGFASAPVDPRVVFSIALQIASSAIIVAHNHPSGSLDVSAEDLAVTRRLREAGQLLQIAVLDHIILTRDRFVSLKDRGDL